MAKEDAEKWNRRYLRAGHNLTKPRDFLVSHLNSIPASGFGLDVAMGLGHNAHVLANHGLTVIGLDISKVALKKAVLLDDRICPVLCDLPHIRFPQECFDVILNFWFLDRALFPLYKKFLKPGGFLFFETMQKLNMQVHSSINPDYLIEPAELIDSFGEWEIIVYDEYVNVQENPDKKYSLRFLARKPN